MARKLQWTPEALELVRSGMGAREVAHRLGCHHSTVARKRQELEWSAGQPRYAMPPPSSGSTMPAPSRDIAPPVTSDQPWRVLFVPDTHAPYHDVSAWSLMMAAARLFEPHAVVALGDFVDCYSVSKYPKDPGRRIRWEDEIISARSLLDDLDSLGAQAKHFIMGNHEARWTRYLAERCPEAAAMLPTVADQLGLPARGWQVTGYRDGVTIGDTYCTHDLGRHGLTAVRRAGEEMRRNVVIGHVHKVGLNCIGGRHGGPTTQAACFGWLGDVEQVDYRHKEMARRDYQLGFGVGYVEADGRTHLEACPIVNGSVKVRGRIVKVAA